VETLDPDGNTEIFEVDEDGALQLE